MARYIDAERFKLWLQEKYVLYDGDRYFSDIDAQPTADVVEVVRCKDCKHRPSGDGANHNIVFPDYSCPCQCEDFWYSWIPTDNWFCGNGERRE